MTMSDKDKCKAQREIIDSKIKALERRRGGHGNTLPVGGDVQMEILLRIKEDFDLLDAD